MLEYARVIPIITRKNLQRGSRKAKVDRCPQLHPESPINIQVYTLGTRQFSLFIIKRSLIPI